ncbi:MAG: hypothetical protein ACFFBD_26000 [Candidatus Hodarchaeota archaeon]
MKKQITCVLLIFLTVGATIGNIPSVSGIIVGDTANWKASAGPMAFFYDITMDITIIGETASRWLVDFNLRHSTNPLPLFSADSLEKISKNESLGGFPLRMGGGCWGLWIYPQNVSETKAFVLECLPSGLPMWVLLATIGSNPPLITENYTFTFFVESGRLLLNKTIYDIWFFQNSLLNLYYDAKTGILVKMVIGGVPIELVSSTFSGVESSDVFTLDVVVVSLCVFVLGTVLWRKRHVHKNKKIGVRGED